MKTDRRNFLRTIGTGATGIGLSSPILLTSSCSQTGLGKEKDQVLFIGDNIALNDTTNGKVRGFILRDTYHFLGIPYGADTSGENRFMPPRKPKLWNDIYPAVYWANAAPQILDNFYANRYLAFTDYWHYDDVSENCLGINVWTPGYSDGKKRPVMLWIHGGGFRSGNAIEHPEYMGENLSRLGDIVFCSLNHRLGPLGFADFAGIGGEKYAASGNVGMLDIVAALEWIRDNIANFGGDPGNVTIMGQSGGGAKVCTLTAMPSAKGLFHKAVALSGSMIMAGVSEDSRKLGDYIMKEAGLAASQIDKLQEMPWRDYYAIANKANTKFLEEAGPADSRMRRGFNPVVDGQILPQHPFYPEASLLAADIPMIICTTFYERSPSSFDSSLENISFEEAKKQAASIRGFGSPVGDSASAAIDAYAKAFPDRKPIEILSMVISNRKSAISVADAKSKQTAPVYLAWFGWNPPLFDGRLRAFHTLDICFWYYNTDVQLSHSGGGERPRMLSAKMAGSLLQFMRTGSPDGGGLPTWPRYTKENGETMILDDKCEVRNDPDREARKSLPA
jgi:para-nitrobenzyl esterase